MIGYRLFLLAPSARAPPFSLITALFTVCIVVASLSASRPSPGQIVQSFSDSTFAISRRTVIRWSRERNHLC
jgi:hypothetical protein